ncbi:MAG: hypothetical protein ABI680_02515 [Chthoniobacteraceae bacterium]
MIGLANYAPPRSCKVYTPRKLAEAMVTAAGVTADTDWLEPSSGAGVFIEVMRENAIPRSRITAIDLARKTHDTDSLATTFRGIDYLAWTIAKPRQFDRIVGNPPYVPFDELPIKARSVARTIGIGTDNCLLAGTANLWAAFVAAAVRQLRFGGSLAFVLPAAWDYADYASGLRAWLPTLFREFHVFRCARPLFEEVEEGSVVILGRGFGTQGRDVQRHECENVDLLIAALLAASPAQEKLRKEESRKATMGGVCLGEIAEIRIGAVTGDNPYFLLTEEDRIAHNLPTTALQPVVSRASHICTNAITSAQWKKLKDSNERIWLFRPPDSLLTTRSVARYLQLSAEEGGCKRTRHKVSIRTPWHRTPLPRPPHAFISGMAGNAPKLCFNRVKNLTATNTLYVVRFSPKLAPGDRLHVAEALQSPVVTSQLVGLLRRYPGGLLKLEPSDFCNIRLPNVFKNI